MELCWNVYTEDINNCKIKIYNVFEHEKFKEEIIDSFNKCWDKEDLINCLKFSERVKDITRYYFWGKCEWEIILSDWPSAPEGRFNKEKVSVYDQLMLNWDSFVDHIITVLINS